MEKIKQWINNNGRQLEIAMYDFIFEDGKKEDVVKELKHYQNKDGGFGHGLEPDFRNPNSNPIACEVAAKIIQDLDLAKDHLMVVSLIEFLKTTDYKESWFYFYSIPSNNDFPHAPWWHYNEDRKIVGYNPTASILGFLYKYMDPLDPIYTQVDLAVDQAVKYFIENDVVEMHELKCFNRLYEQICEKIDCKLLGKKLLQQNTKVISKDSKKWFTEYSPKPTQVFVSMHSPGANELMHLIDLELNLSFDHRNKEGVFDIPWDWGQYKDISKIAKREWMGIIALKTLRAVREYKLHISKK